MKAEQFNSKKVQAAVPITRVPKVVDLFAGAGGFSLGAMLAGAEVTFAVELDKFATSTYRKNLCGKGQTALYTTDIVDLDARALAAKHFPNNSECDLLLGGPPCQGFSTHRINDAGVNDPRNKLIYRYFDFVSALRPRAFLMENVPGLLWPRHQGYLEKFYEIAMEQGYDVLAPTTLDARDFGVPQRRRRVFILGISRQERKHKINWPPTPTHSKEGDDLLKKWTSCQDAFAPTYWGDPNDQHMNHSEELIKAFQKTPPNGGSRKDSGRVLRCHKNHDGHKDVYGRIDARLPAPTMTTACINPSKGRFLHPVENHGITVRQAARIQTFPDNFIFEGGLTAAGKQIGNAVPVRLAETLVRHLLEELRLDESSLQGSLQRGQEE